MLSYCSTTITGKLISNVFVRTVSTTVTVTSGSFYAVVLGQGYSLNVSITNFTTILDTNAQGFGINATSAVGFVRLVFGKATSNQIVIGQGDTDNERRIMVIEIATS